MSLFGINRLPAMSLENKSRGIPELRLHHVVIIATWRALTLNRRIKLYLGTEVTSEYLFGGSQDFHLCSQRADSTDTYDNPIT